MCISTCRFNYTYTSVQNCSSNGFHHVNQQFIFPQSEKCRSVCLFEMIFLRLGGVGREESESKDLGTKRDIVVGTRRQRCVEPVKRSTPRLWSDRAMHAGPAPTCLHVYPLSVHTPQYRLQTPPLELKYITSQRNVLSFLEGFTTPYLPCVRRGWMKRLHSPL